jgi:enoyl-CoA hydratase
MTEQLMTQQLLTEVRGKILVITLNRPETVNAITTEMAQALLAAIDRLESTPELSVGVITGAGRGFCPGLDLKAMGTKGTPRGLRTFVRRGCAKPLVAAIEGFALAGGLEIALTCDLLVAAEDAKLGLPETRVGLFPAAGGLLRLSERVSGGLVAEMVLTGDPISAERARAHGLISRTCAPGQALSEALELAGRIARNGPLGLAASKRLLRSVQGRTEEEYWPLESELAESVFRSQDAKEGPRAFAEKRHPNWTGS